jgi:RNA polymerase sigma-70 factor (ECF subfamily)
MGRFRDRSQTTEGAAKVHPTDCDGVYELVEQARTGDRVAFGQLYDIYFQKLFKYALVRTGSQSDAEDVAAEAMIQAWRNLDRFQWMGAPFVSWLLVLTQRRIATMYRTRSKQAVLTQDGDVGALDALEAAPDEQAASDLRSELAGALQQLPERHREVIALRFFGGLSAEEIGEALGMKANAVRQLQMKALERLRYNANRSDFGRAA